MRTITTAARKTARLLSRSPSSPHITVMAPTPRRTPKRLGGRGLRVWRTWTGSSTVASRHRHRRTSVIRRSTAAASQCQRHLAARAVRRGFDQTPAGAATRIRRSTTARGGTTDGFAVYPRSHRKRRRLTATSSQALRCRRHAATHQTTSGAIASVRAVPVVARARVTSRTRPTAETTRRTAATAPRR